MKHWLKLRGRPPSVGGHVLRIVTTRPEERFIHADGTVPFSSCTSHGANGEEFMGRPCIDRTHAGVTGVTYFRKSARRGTAIARYFCMRSRVHREQAGGCQDARLRSARGRQAGLCHPTASFDGRRVRQFARDHVVCTLPTAGEMRSSSGAVVRTGDQFAGDSALCRCCHARGAEF